MRGIVMTVLSKTGVWYIQRTAQIAAMGVFATLAGSLVIATIGSALGLLPWLSVPLTFSDGTVLAAGPVLQIALAALALLLCAYMPANMRMLQLENSHRSFNLRMEDVANAYWAAHEADRSGVFKMKAEFDAVKERMMFLRDHPDLGHLEPDILETAAKMSRLSEDLAERYSDDALARATDFLAQREIEADQMQTRIEAAQAATTELKRWTDRVEMEEAVARSRMGRLREELDEVLRKLDLEVIEVPKADSHPPKDVIPLPRPKRRANAIPAE